MRVKSVNPLPFPLGEGGIGLDDFHTHCAEFPGPHFNSNCASPASHVSFLRTKENLDVAMLAALISKLTLLYFIIIPITVGIKPDIFSLLLISKYFLRCKL